VIKQANALSHERPSINPLTALKFQVTNLRWIVTLTFGLFIVCIKNFIPFNPYRIGSPNVSYL